MVKRTQGLPINTIVLAIIALLVVIFLVLIFTGGIGKFTSGTSSVGPTNNQINSTQCAEYATQLQTSIETSSDPNTQISLIQSSQYVIDGCPAVYAVTYNLANNSQVVCNGNTQISGEICIQSTSSTGSGSGSTTETTSNGGTTTTTNSYCSSGQTPTGCYLT